MAHSATCACPTRPLTDSDLRACVQALSGYIAHLHGDMVLDSTVSDEDICIALRPAAEALAAVTDHMCSDYRWRHAR